MLATGGTLGVTASAGIDIAGTVSAAGTGSGFDLLATSGDAILEPSGLLAGAALNVIGDAIAGNQLQAPNGRVLIAGASGTTGFASAGTVGPVIPATGYQIAPPASPPAVIRLSPPSVGTPGAAATAARLSGATIDIERPVSASTLGLFATKSIIEGPSALIDASRLTGASGNDVALNQANVIGTLGAFDDTGRAFRLVDGSNLMLTGVLSANSVQIIDTRYSIEVAAGTGFSGIGPANGNPLKTQPFPLASNPPAVFRSPLPAGIYLVGSGFTVAANPTVSTGYIIDWTFALSGSGNVGLGTFLQPKVALFLDLGTGTATGRIDVAGLQIRYTTPTKVTVDLSGTVGGISGPYAASASHIQSLPKNNYQINGCPISSVNCVRFTGLTVPVTNPLHDVDFGDLLPIPDIDIILPDVAERDY